MNFDQLTDLYEEKKLELVLEDLGGDCGKVSVYKYEEIRVREEDKDMAYLLSRCFGKRLLVFQAYYSPINRYNVIRRLYGMVSLGGSSEVTGCYGS